MCAHLSPTLWKTSVFGTFHKWHISPDLNVVHLYYKVLCFMAETALTVVKRACARVLVNWLRVRYFNWNDLVLQKSKWVMCDFNQTHIKPHGQQYVCTLCATGNKMTNSFGWLHKSHPNTICSGISSPSGHLNAVNELGVLFCWSSSQ